MKMPNPYAQCPVFETSSFMIRLIALEDAQDLLRCYSDAQAQKIFNCDHCTGDFRMSTVDAMTACIKAWLLAYQEGQYIRFAIVDKRADQAIGTIEIFGGDTGVLRVDVPSGYENETCLKELFDLSIERFHDMFPVVDIITKAVPEAAARRSALMKCGFEPYRQPSGRPRENYYVHTARKVGMPA
jgi:RimJ/RimL family protein N-acetyltransferase